MTFPTLVSFYCGEKYYYDAAQLLRDDCKRLNILCDIREIHVAANVNWAEICRAKIPFYREMLTAHPNGIFWVDVDTRLMRRPDMLEFARYDLGAFLRGFRDLRSFDPVALPRTFVPGFLHFTGTKRASDFVDHLATLEATSDAAGTDDYFLEEAYRSFDPGLNIHLFNPAILAIDPDRVTSDTCLLCGLSGNVKLFKDQVEQHTIDLFSAVRQRTLLQARARDALRRRSRPRAIMLLEEAHLVDPAHDGVALQLTKLMSGSASASISTILRVLKTTFGDSFVDARAIKIAVDACLQASETRRALAIFRRFKPITAEDEAYHASRKFRLDLELRAERRGLVREDRPAMWWMETPYPGNLGDVLNPYLVEKLSGMPPILARRGEGILAIGSVIKFAKPGTIIWGTGTPRMTDTLSPDAIYRAVRGPLTRNLVLASGGDAPELYGDPAMLLPLVHRPGVAKRHRLGLILHHVHEAEPIAVENVTRISILRVGYDQIEAFIDEVCACEAIISTSLHGLIVAHAYGIPTKWATFSDGAALAGDDTKFEDHYAAFGIRHSGPLDLSGLSAITPELAILCDEVTTKPLRALELLQAAPFPVQDRYLTAACAI